MNYWQIQTQFLSITFAASPKQNKNKTPVFDLCSWCLSNFLEAGCSGLYHLLKFKRKRKKSFPLGLPHSPAHVVSTEAGWIETMSCLFVFHKEHWVLHHTRLLQSPTGTPTGPGVMPAGSWHSASSFTDCELKAAPSPVRRRAKGLFRLHIPSRETKNIWAGRTNEMVSLGLHSPLYFSFSPFSFSFLALFPIPSPLLWLFFPSRSVMTSKLAQHRCSRS